jgi:hypothetical protein
MKISDIIASAGVLTLLIAFLLNLSKRITVESKLYAGLNFSGAALCGIAAYMVPFYPFVVLEAVWAGVALFALLRNVPRGTSPAKS